jgi:hypothetical protein
MSASLLALITILPPLTSTLATSPATTEDLLVVFFAPATSPALSFASSEIVILVVEVATFELSIYW